MDPVSFAASLVTLLGLASAATEIVYNSILDIRDAPKEIRSQAVKLQCLHKTLRDLLAQYTRYAGNAQLYIDPLLEDNLREFLGDIQDLEVKLKNSSSKMSGCRKQHLRERLTWLSSDRKLRKFYDSLDEWNGIFNAAIKKTHGDLLARIVEQIPQTQPMLLNIQSRQQQMLSAINTSQQGSIAQNVATYTATTTSLTTRERAVLSPAVRAFLSRRRDLTGFMNEFSYSYNAKAVMAGLRAGPAIVKSWSSQGKSVRRVIPWEDGACLVLTLQTLWPFSRRIDVMVSYILDLPQMSLNFSLATYGVLQKSHPAVLASKSGDWQDLRQLLQEKKVGIFDRTVDGTSLLHMAVRRGHCQMVVGLLENGAQVDAADSWGRTPLILATSLNSGYRVARLLLAEGADLYHQDDSGKTALHQCFAATGRAILRFHQDDIDFSSQDSLGRSVVFYICLSSKSRAVDLTRCRKNYLKSLDGTDNHGQSVLHVANRTGNQNLVAYLHRHRTLAMLRPDLFGQSAMHYDEQNDQAPIIDFLTRNNFNIHAVDNTGSTALHQAAKWDDVISVQNLLDLGAEPNLEIPDDKGRTPLHLALERRCLGVLYLLLNQFPHLWKTLAPPVRHGVNLLHAAINHDDTTFFERVLELCISDMDAVDQYGRTPFQLAIRCKQKELVAHLIAQYPHVKSQVRPKDLAAVLSRDAPARDTTVRQRKDSTGSKSLALNWVHKILESLGAYMLLWLVVQFWTSFRVFF